MRGHVASAVHVAGADRGGQRRVQIVQRAATARERAKAAGLRGVEPGRQFQFAFDNRQHVGGDAGMESGLAVEARPYFRIEKFTHRFQEFTRRRSVLGHHFRLS